MKIAEFREWLNQCVSDGQEKLGLDYSDIAYCLLEKSKEVILYLLNRSGRMTEEKLYCLLYFLDFDFYEKYEKHFMGFTWIK